MMSPVGSEPRAPVFRNPSYIPPNRLAISSADIIPKIATARPVPAKSEKPPLQGLSPRSPQFLVSAAPRGAPFQVRPTVAPTGPTGILPVGRPHPHPGKHPNGFLPAIAERKAAAAQSPPDAPRHIPRSESPPRHSYRSSFAIIFFRKLRLKSREPPKKRFSARCIGSPASRRNSIK